MRIAACTTLPITILLAGSGLANPEAQVPVSSKALASANASPHAVAGNLNPSVALGDPLGTLNGAQLQELFQWLSQHAVDPASLTQESLNRAALRSLLTDPRTGAVILPAQTGAAPGPVMPPLHARLGPNAAYARAGSLSGENVTALSAFLSGLPPEATTLILDLRTALPPDSQVGHGGHHAAPSADPGGPPLSVRGSAGIPAVSSGSLAGAAALASLFLPQKTPLFLLLAPPAAPALQISAAAPVWTRRVWLLVDNNSYPPSELAAHLLLRHLDVLTFGSPTSGNLTETTDRPLGPNHVVRLPAATVAWPDGTRLTGTSVIPKITVPALPGSRQALLTLKDPSGLPALIVETDRPRVNEAALMAGTPPELLAPSMPALNAPPMPRPDPVLQQAVDLLQTSSILKLDAPEEIKRAGQVPNVK